MKHAQQARPSEKYLGVLKKRYAKATKKERSVILDEFVKTTGYHRTHAAQILSERYVRQARPIRRMRAAIYTSADHKAVWQIGEWFDQIGSKRLRVAMDVELSRLRVSGHLQVSEETYQHLLAIGLCARRGGQFVDDTFLRSLGRRGLDRARFPRVSRPSGAPAAVAAPPGGQDQAGSAPMAPQIT